MNEDFNTGILNPGRKHFLLATAIIGVIMLFMSSGAAINIDEILHYNQAKKVLSWYLTSGEDKSCLETPKTNLKYYGQMPDNLSALINKIFSIKNEYQTRHYLGFVFSFLLVLITGLIAFEISENYFIAILSMILLFISPRPIGQAFGNLKDIPFAMGYAWCILLIIKLFKAMPSPGWKNTLLLGLAIAFTNSVRIGGMIFFPYIGLFLLTWVLVFRNKSKEIINDLNWWGKIILKGIVVLLTGYFAGLLFWPFGLINPVKNPLEALSVMEHYKISIKQIFEGIQAWSTNLPWYYLPKWLLISIPEVTIIGTVLYFIIGQKRKRENLFLRSILIFSFIFPIIYVIIINSNLYSGWRQMYFIYPPLVVLSSLGLMKLYKRLKKPLLQISWAMTLILVLIPLVHSAKNYPSEYIYFNSLTGSTKKAWSNYEYDYYWHEMKKASNWLAKELEGNNKDIRIASNFDIRSYLYDKNIRFEYVHFYDKISVDWDYAILGVNYVHPFQLKNNTWQPRNIKKTFYHDGNPTIIILKGQDKNAFNGYSAFLDNNFERADSLLSLAMPNDPTDLNIIAYLGESRLALNRFEDVKKLIANGKELHPYYEPFLLLDAKIEIKQKNYPEGLELLKILFRENPRYFKALPYLIECYEKTGQKEKAKQIKKKYNV
ncbi:MAG: hypothetical protein JXR31_08630 [Prolixibacteraceae bacterium]|nr:hypothetical protein [Prolixibacteraceae bacterium]MBN2774300.1 hypothetical protein [Prolixibacteraceae bacterium]